MSPARWITVALLLAVAAAAQVPYDRTKLVEFDPAKELDGWAEARRDARDLINFHEFDRSDGKLITRTYLAELKELWRVERAKAAAALEKRANNPLTPHVEKLRGWLKRSPFFSKIDYRINADHPPFIFCIERPKRRDEEAAYYRHVVAETLPWMQRMQKIFKERYAEPLGLKRHDPDRPYVAVILSSEGAYKDFGKSQNHGDLHAARAHYNHRDQILFTYKERFATRSGTERRERRAVLHEFVHALQHAWCATGKMTQPTWFNEGFAEYMSVCYGMSPSDLDERVIDREHLATVKDEYGDRVRARQLLTVKEILRVRTYQDVVEVAARKARKDARTMSPDERHRALYVFYAQVDLLTWFLHQEKSGRYRRHLMRYYASVFAGKGGHRDFNRIFGDVADAADLDDEFRRFIGSR